jgi:hypothetical protein
MHWPGINTSKRDFPQARPGSDEAPFSAGEAENEDGDDCAVWSSVVVDGGNGGQRIGC